MLEKNTQLLTSSHIKYSPYSPNVTLRMPSNLISFPWHSPSSAPIHLPWPSSPADLLAFYFTEEIEAIRGLFSHFHIYLSHRFSAKYYSKSTWNDSFPLVIMLLTHNSFKFISFSFQHLEALSFFFFYKRFSLRQLWIHMQL